MFTCPGVSFSSGQSFPWSTNSSRSDFSSDVNTFSVSGLSHLSVSHGCSTDNYSGSFSSSDSSSSPGFITDSSSSFGFFIYTRNFFSFSFFTGSSPDSFVGSIINSNSGTSPSSTSHSKLCFNTDTDLGPSFSISSCQFVSISDTLIGNRELPGILFTSDSVIDSSIILSTNSSSDIVFGIRTTTWSYSDTLSGSPTPSGSSFSNGLCASSHTDFDSSIIIIFISGSSISADIDLEPCSSSIAYFGPNCISDSSTGSSLNTSSSFPSILPYGFGIWSSFLACHRGLSADCSQG